MENINLFGIVTETSEMSEETKKILAAEEEYRRYIENHILNVRKAYRAMRDNTYLNSNSNSDIKAALITLGEDIENHDASKWGDSEFEAYRVRWYPVTEEEKENAAKDEDWLPYKEAWEHHYHVNQHHPEYWYDEEEGVPMRDMPLHRILEMICDWESFSFIGKGNAVDYWAKARERKAKYMTPNTLAQVDRIINILKKDE